MGGKSRRIFSPTILDWRQKTCCWGRLIPNFLKSRGLEGKINFFVEKYNRMTEKEHNDGGNQILLDGSPPCPRQNLEGNFSPLYEVYEKTPMKKFLNFEEWLEYTDGVKIRPFDSWATRANKIMREEELRDKIDYEYIIDYYNKEQGARREANAQRRLLERRSKNRHELGAREFTFTYSPKWFDDAEARLRMSTGIQKLAKYYKDEIHQLRAVGEVGTNGLSHIHCFYLLKNGNKITDKNFKRAYSMWSPSIRTGPTGHQGGHHANVRNPSDFQGYIDKDIQSAWFEVNIDNSDPVAVNS